MWNRGIFILDRPIKLDDDEESQAQGWRGRLFLSRVTKRPAGSIGLVFQHEDREDWEEHEEGKRLVSIFLLTHPDQNGILPTIDFIL